MKKSKKKILQEFKEYLKEANLKFTSQREEILNEILKTRGHFEVEDIVYKLKNKKKSVSRATVYRTLSILKKMGIINEVIKYKNKTIYELGLEKHHDHLICVECGKIIEFFDRELEEIQDNICKTFKFFPYSHRLEIYGLCETCYEKEKSKIS